MSNKLRAQLKNLRKEEGLFQADPSWVANNKKVLFSQIEQTENNNTKETKRRQNYFIYFVRSFVFNSRLNLIARPAFMMFLVFTLTAGGWMATASATNSIPGDLLYSVKRAAESIQVAVTSPKNKSSVHLSLARKRSVEVTKVLQENKPKVKELVQKNLEDMKDNLESAKENLKEAREKTDKVKVVQDMLDTKKEITQNLETQTNSGEVGLALKNDLSTVVDDAGVTIIDAAKDLLAEDGEDVDGEVKRVVKEVVETVIADATKALADGKTAESTTTEEPTILNMNNTSGVEDLGVSTTTTIVSGTAGIVTSSLDTTTNTINVIKTTKTLEDVAGAVKKADGASGAVEIKTVEIKDLLENDKLSEAIGKAQELNQATRDSKKATSDAKDIALEVDVNSRSASTTVSTSATSSTTSSLIEQT